MTFALQPLKRAHKKFAAQHAAMVHAALADAGAEGVREAEQKPGYTHRTGALARANEYQVIRTRGGHLLRLRNRKPYAAAIDKGARPHPIYPRRAKVLAFYSAKAGRMVFVRYVKRHPGNRPYRFLWRGMRRAKRHARMLLLRNMKRLASRF